MWIHSAVHEILANKYFTVTDGLISQSFVVALVPVTYVQIAPIWDFLVQLGLWKLVHWLWRYKLNEVCDTSLQLCYRSQWITEYPQSWNLHSLTVLSEICWCMMFSCSWFQSRWQSICQGLVLLNYSTFKEILWKIPQTLWNHCPAWYSIVHPLSHKVHALCSSSFPYIHAWTCHIQFFFWENTTGPHSSYNQQGTQIWKFLR